MPRRKVDAMGRVKLDSDDIVAMVKKYQRGKVTLKEVGLEFHCNPSTVSRHVRGLNNLPQSGRQSGIINIVQIVLNENLWVSGVNM